MIKPICFTFLISILLMYLSIGCSKATLSKGNEKYNLGEYYDAANIYKKVYNKTKPKDREKRGLLAFKMATCYRLINYSARAEASYQNTIRYDYPDSTALFYTGEILKKNGKYKDAIKKYEEYLKYVPNDKLALNGIEACKLAPDWKKKPTLYTIKKMDKFNSRRGDFSPMLLPPDGDKLFITSFRDQVVGKDINGVIGTRFNDIFVASLNEKQQWEAPEIIESEINTEFDDGVCAFSADGKTMYFTRAKLDAERPAPSEIYSSPRSDAIWGTPKKIEIVKDSINSVGHPAPSPDGDYLLFVSDMPGGIGGKDIWKYYLKGKEQGVVENMGPMINTPGDEMFPYIRSNGELYFASNGHPGMGGLDLFKANKNKDGSWNIQNMRYPINSNGDDFGITFAQEKEEGFFCSNRGDARGWDHIYSFTYPSFSMDINGIIWDTEDEPVPNSMIRIIGSNGTNQKVVAKQDGSYIFNAEPGVEYLMLASCDGYLNARQEIVTDNDTEQDHSYIVDFVISAISKPVLIENIFYDFNKADLRPESEEALNKLIVLLNDNPHVTIELGAHTDMKGTDAYNDKLSQRRAESVVNYLIKNGIDSERLTAKGYGETVPVTVTKKIAAKYDFLKQDSILNEPYILTLALPQQDTACQINRRTEFRVLKTTYKLY